MKEQELTDQLKRVEQEIEAVKKRLPAHSVKPPIMIELFDLEDQKAELEKQVETSWFINKPPYRIES